MGLDLSEPSLYEHFFADPEVGDGVLRPGGAGIACRNIRTALGILGYQVPYGESFDEELARAVLQLQTDCGHATRDGLVGPGTRLLLAGKLLERYNHEIFQRLEAPVSGLVFVSYLREDAERIAAYIDALQCWGLRVWYDREIPGGTGWMQAIEEKVTQCDLAVVFLSQAASESKWVQREVAFADALDKPTLAIRLDAGDLAAGWGVWSSSNQVLDATHGDVLQELKQAVHHIVRSA